MVRLCIGCMFSILIILTIVYLYLLMNVMDNNNIINGYSNKPLSKRIQRNYTLDESIMLIQKKIQKSNNSFEKKCQVVHIAIVCAGYNSTTAVVTMIKSILFYRTKPLHFHMIVDEIASRSLTILFDTWELPNVIISYYEAEIWIPKVSWIPNKHYSGVYGLLKLLLPEAIKEEKIIVLDTDITVLTDISILWEIFHEFNKDQLIGLVENQSDWYIKPLPNGQRPWPALGRGFNTGVMLMNLQVLRAKKINEKWTKISKSVLNDISETTLADQDIINAVIQANPKIIFRIHCTWNIQLSDHTLSESCYANEKNINIIHWNSPRKQSVQHKNVQDFRKMYRVFLELDGNLLRRKLFGCFRNSTVPSINRSDPCFKFHQGATISYRTHYFYLEYYYNVFSQIDVVLVTQCSADRMLLLEELCKHWSGPISVALYLTDVEVQHFVDFVQESEELRNRKNVAYHIVYKDGEFYPINYLRNVAMTYLSVPYIFQLDIDFLPQFELYEILMKYISKLKLLENEKTALIVPAFETERYRFTFPKTKEELLKSLSRGTFYTFRYHVWSKGHSATNYSLWRSASEPYEVFWEPDFEPYIVVSKSTPEYDRRFIGFGWNKVSYITHLTALGYRYLVLPDAFIIHRPHAPSRDIGKFRVDVVYRRCLRKLKDKFVQELLLKYGETAAIKLKKLIEGKWRTLQKT